MAVMLSLRAAKFCIKVIKFVKTVCVISTYYGSKTQKEVSQLKKVEVCFQMTYS